MVRKALALIIAIMLAIAGAVILTAHLFSAPARFIIKNLDSEPVRVTAQWRDKTKNIGQLSPNTSIEFFIEDEALMTLAITRANGTAVTVRNIHFKPDLSTRVEITRTRVEVKTDSQPQK